MSFFSCLFQVVTTKNQYITDITAEQLSYVIRRLVPYTEHTISVSAFTIMGEGPPTVITVRTREQGTNTFPMKQILANIIHVNNSLTSSSLLTVHSSFQVPSSIQTINYKNISSSSILLYWDPPEYPNGKITHYTIYAMELDTHRAFQMTTVDTSFLITGRRKRRVSFCTPPPLIEMCTNVPLKCCSMHSRFWWHVLLGYLRNIYGNNDTTYFFNYIYPQNIKKGIITTFTEIHIT